MKINRYKSSNSSVPSSSANKSISSSSAIENNLKDGHISGSLSRENSKTFLSLPNGDKIEVKLQADMPLGRLMSFAAFKSPSGEIILKLSDSTKNVIMLDSLVKNFNLPDTDQIRELINLFMNKSLPLNRQELIKANFNSSNFNIPTHTITNLLAKSISLSPEQLLIAKDLINSGLLPLAKDISNAIVFNLDDANKQKILDFINRFNPANLGTESDLRYPANLGSESDLRYPTNLGTASNLSSPANLGSAINLNSVANLSQTDLANLVSDFLLGLPLNSSSQHLAINNNALQDFIDLVALLNLDNVREDPSQPTIQERLDVLSKLESADFELLSPMLLSNLLNGSVHFFNEKPNSSNASKKSNGLYIVVALDLANLDHIEFHIHKFDKLLDIQIYVANIDLKKFLSSFSHSFSFIADECGLKINNFFIDSIEQKHEINPKLKEQRSFSSNFDFRV
ncbi:hypothetical protein AN643_03000 [Candidatus Epulonipiscioides saccharophilum]|nr:hypothetical protein AN643_03000 [Epulopiscium sp. SCG-B10WGA-EpuloB]